MNRELPVGSITSPASSVASSVAASNAITLDGHGLETNDQVTVRAIEGGTLSAPLDATVTYFVRRLTNASFELALTSGGAAIDLTSNGIEMIATREPNYDRTIEFYSRWIDAFFPAHVVPFGVTEPVHPTVSGICARLVAKAMMNVDGKDSAVLDATELACKAMLERFMKGLDLRGAAAPGNTNLAVTLTSGASDARGWPSGSLP